MKHNVEAFKKYYINATKEEVIEDMFLDCCEQAKEIERLKIIEEKYKDSQLYIHDFKEEVERLNNIINELFDYLKEHSEQPELFESDRYYEDVLDKLIELKGSNNGVWVNNLLEVIKENNIEFGSDKE